MTCTIIVLIVLVEILRVVGHSPGVLLFSFPAGGGATPSPGFILPLGMG
jgi:hypothetical protein